MYDGLYAECGHNAGMGNRKSMHAILVSVFFLSLHPKHFRIKFLLLVPHILTDLKKCILQVVRLQMALHQLQVSLEYS